MLLGNRLMFKQKIMIIAGEASGDHRGAEVATELHYHHPNIELFGICGEEMKQAGVREIANIDQLSVMGFFEPLKHLPRIIKLFKRMKRSILDEKPDLIIFVDNPGFNLRLAKAAKALKVKVLFYVSPQVWAWRQGRVKHIAKVVDHMAVLFPFEKKFYQDHDVPVTYVGHPLTQKIKSAPSYEKAREALGIHTKRKVVTLLPGSRTAEITRLLPVMLESVEKLSSTFPNLIFVLALASTVKQASIQSMIDKCKHTLIISTHAMTTISAADAVITSSGTATLETALLNKPMVIIYKVHTITALLIKRMLKIPYIGLCNIVAGSDVSKELLQNKANAENITEEVEKILFDQEYRNTMISKLKSTNQLLGDSKAAENVAKIAVTMIN
jgi:lipid-A-disaccharide synthase